MTRDNIFTPETRSFNHVNLSNPQSSWGAKFESHCVAGLATRTTNFLIGDSTFERMSRRHLLPLTQAKLPGWLNCGIGGDRAQHIQWRLLHGGSPENPGKCILAMGSNNIRTGNSKECQRISNSIVSTASYLLEKHPRIKLAVVGILPREGEGKCQAARTINAVVKYKLPSDVFFVPPPNIISDKNGTPNMRFYETDHVHLNIEGYRVLLDSLGPFINMPHPSHHHPMFSDDFGIGEPELLGRGWDGLPTPQPPPYSPPPYSPPPSPSPPTSFSPHPTPSTTPSPTSVVV